jgi:hypothetical protein
MVRRLLITARHPGPADLILGLLPNLAEYMELHIIATDAALQLLLDRGRHTLRDCATVLWTHGTQGFHRVDLSAPPALPPPATFSATQIDPADLASAERLVRQLSVFFSSFRPDLFLRTTPSSLIGIDELAPAALRSGGFRTPIHCLQDYYDVGLALRDNEHPVAKVGIDAIATVDEAAARSARERSGRDAAVIGWASFDKYLTGLPYREARVSGRRLLDLPKNGKLVLYAGIRSGLSNGNDLLDFEQCLASLVDYSALRPELRVALRTHPRCPPEEQLAYQTLCQKYDKRIRFQSIDQLTEFRQVLAAPDALLSPASALNLDALAYAATEPDPETQSVFLTGPYARAAIRASVGPALPPTHQPGNGSFLADYETLGDVLDQALFSPADQAAAAARAAALYRPDGACALRVARFLGPLTK